MSAAVDTAAIKELLDDIEAAHRRQRRRIRRLHNMLAAALAAYGPGAGIEEGEIIALGGGTNKDDEEED